ncbi:Helix-turn-helix domain protein [uncultured archaeon]|nr:Helix-turn-helix domain protein [uncultured archaeon]
MVSGNCAVCGKAGADTLLFEGIYNGSVRPVCRFCSVNEKITLVKKPTEEQLKEAEKRQSVRQLMEKLSSPQAKIMSKDSMIAHKNLAKLKFPSMKQEHTDLVQNYDWVLKQARRHRKLSTTQLAQMAGIDRSQLESLESGQVFTGFEKVVEKIEKVLDVKIIKNYEPIARINRTPEQRKEVEKEILTSVNQKVAEQKKRGIFSFFKRDQDEKENADLRSDYDSTNIADIRKEMAQEAESPREIQHKVIDVEKLKEQKKEEHNKRISQVRTQIESEDFDFSDRKKLDNIKLQDLAELKKMRDSRGR